MFFKPFIEKLKRRLLEFLVNTRNSINLSLFKGVLFVLIFFSYLFICFSFNLSLEFKIIGSIIILLLWKIIQGMSWLNFYFLLLAIIALTFLSFWFKRIFILLDLSVLLYLVIKKIIYNQTEVNNYLFYFIGFNWTLMSFGLYFYANQLFTLSLIIYLIGFGILCFYQLLLKNKQLPINYWAVLLISAQLYLLLSYLSINGFFFSFLLVVLTNIIISHL